MSLKKWHFLCWWLLLPSRSQMLPPPPPETELTLWHTISVSISASSSLSQVSVASDSGRRKTAALLSDQHSVVPTGTSHLSPSPSFPKTAADWVTVPGFTWRPHSALLDLERKAKLLTHLTAGFEMELVFCDSVLLLIAQCCSHAPLRTTRHVTGHQADIGTQSTNRRPH